MRQAAVLLCLIVSINLPTRQSCADSKAAQFLPSSVVLYAETSSTGELLSDVLDHPQRKRIESLPQYQQWLHSEGYRKLQMVTKLVEAQLDAPWREAIETLGAGGIHVAFDGASQSPALLVQSADALMLEKAKNAILNLALMGAAGDGKAVPFKPVDYRGIEAYRSDKIRFAIFDRWLVLTNSGELGKGILDRMLDRSDDSLAGNEQFQAALATRPADARAWAYADLKTIRSAGVAKRLLGGKSENPGAELIVGGILNTLSETPYAAAHLTSRGGTLEFAARVPHDSDWTPVERGFFFGPDDSGIAPPAIALPDTILEARAYRGVSGMWLHGPDLFDEEINAQLAKANSNLSTLFGGRPFAEDILGALDGGLRLLVVREQHETPSTDKAAIKLPGFAAIARLKDPQGTQRPLRIAFQTALGFANLTGAQQGRPPLELETQRDNGKVLLSASYSPDDLADQDQMAMMASGAGVLLQLSPTVGFANDAVVIASTRTLANKILDQLPHESDRPQLKSSDSTVTNTAVQINAPALRESLAENRERLITNNMLEKGHDRAAAEGEIDSLLTILEFFEHADVALRVGDDQLELSVRLTPTQE